MADATLHRYRSHTCGALRKADIDKTARISGWVHRVRDHGGLLFIDLRDHYGLTQIVADPDSAAFKAAEGVRSEWVIRIDGLVRARPDGTINKELPTGEIELFAAEIEVLSKAEELPLPVFGEPDYPEDIRLKYRFLDLRRETLHANIMKRQAIIRSMRRRMADAGFNEFATPILTASSPEGARDFLVPSRIHPGKFYALPQAPQQYKQLLMVSGFDRYFQIAPCFRDEDPRADRLPGEFYQLDVEMSFVSQDDVFATMEPVMTGVFEEFAAGKKVDKIWQRIPHAKAIFFTNANTGVIRNNDNKFYGTTDGGLTWRPLTGSGSNQDLRIAFIDSQLGWSVGRRLMGFTTDGGKHWNTRDFHFPADVLGYSLPRRDRAYVVGEHGMIYRYRVVPIEYTSKGMMEAPMMPSAAGAN